MAKILYETEQKDGVLIYPPLLAPFISSSTPYYAVSYEEESTPSSAFSRISPVLLLTIVILAVIFFISGLLHLLVRFLIKRPSFSAIYQSNRYPEASGSHGLQRQLQQLFRLHDSGLDQASIDALPVFYYKDIMGLKEPFDCAVCLCEFSEKDKLRLLPTCSHAFHIDCIDTWLLSNSTCPLCRGTMLSSGSSMEIPVSNFDVQTEIPDGVSNDGPDGESVLSSGQKRVTVEDKVGSKRVFSVRLGKFRSINDRVIGAERGQGETSSSSLDARRCYSMGTFQYIVGDYNLQVTLSPRGSSTACGRDVKFVEENGAHGCSSIIGDVEDKRIRGRTRGDSFSVSKIWLWSKKNRYLSSSNTHVSLPSPSLHFCPNNDRTETA